MNEEFSKYRHLIKLMEAAPRVGPSNGFTRGVMIRLTEPSPALWSLIKKTGFSTGELTFSGFRRQCITGQESCFYFLIVGLFFFFIGSTLLSSLFYSNYLFPFKIYILITSLLVLMAAFSLLGAGLIMATAAAAAPQWAKRAVLVYGTLIVANAFFIQTAAKTAVGGLMALTFGIAGILMGIFLIRALKSETNKKMVY